MWKRLKPWWPLFKAAFTLAIVLAIGRPFAHDLNDPALWQRPLDPGWLVAAGVLYLMGLGCSALYWHRLLREMGQRPNVLAVVRGYYIGHLGKYLPGKAW